MGMSDIQRASFREAQRLGCDWAGPEHGLLAILRGDPHDTARRVLEEVGLDASMVERVLEQMGRGAKEQRSGVTSNPALHQVYGRAEGFAACLGTGEVRPVHLLLALLWDEWHWLFAEQMGNSRETVVEALGRAGVALPPSPPPELERPIKGPPEGIPTTCQFCGGPIQEGQRFAVPAKDRSWIAFFCSSVCSLGFGVCALVAAGSRGGSAPDHPLAEEFGTGGSWFANVRNVVRPS
jgi:hypothetical protein